METNPNVYGYGTKFIPTFGPESIDVAKSGVAKTIATTFNGIGKNLSGLTVVAGHEFEVQQAWALLVQAQGLLNSAYCGKPMGHA